MWALSWARPYVSRGLGFPWGAGAVASSGPCHGPWTLKTGALQSLQEWDQRQAGGCLSPSRASSMRTPVETKGAPPPFRLAWGSGGGPPAALGGQTTLPNPSPWGSSRLSWAVWLLLLEQCFLFPSCQGQRVMGWGFREAGQGVGWGGKHNPVPACCLSKPWTLLTPLPRTRQENPPTPTWLDAWERGRLAFRW